jgi:hypothetical protein
VGVEQQVERHDEDGEPAAATLDHTANERGRRDEREERRERVHACFLAVVGEVRIDRRKCGADPTRGAAEEGARQPERERDARERRQEGQHMCRALAVPEPADPDVEQEVVERR